VHIPEPNFWLNILQQYRDQDEDEDEAVFYLHISILIAEFAQNNLASLDANVFEQLTDVKFLPRVHFEAALPLIDAERQIKGISVSNELSSLQARCIEAISTNWEHIDFAAKGAVMELAKKQSSIVLAEILSATLSAAKTDKTRHAVELSKFHRLTYCSIIDLQNTPLASLPSIIPVHARSESGQTCRDSIFLLLQGVTHSSVPLTGKIA